VAPWAIFVPVASVEAYCASVRCLTDPAWDNNEYVPTAPWGAAPFDQIQAISIVDAGGQPGCALVLATDTATFVSEGVLDGYCRDPDRETQYSGFVKPLGSRLVLELSSDLELDNVALGSDAISVCALDPRCVPACTTPLAIERDGVNNGLDSVYREWTIDGDVLSLTGWMPGRSGETPDTDDWRLVPASEGGGPAERYWLAL
jgi:hypothetical protein